MTTSISEKTKTRHSRLLFWGTITALMIPNVALCFTESLPAFAAAANLLLPLGIYILLMGLSRNPGKMVWWLFPLIFFAAFQMVLLYLFGQGVIAVDMFLNLVTTNPGEAMELLDNLVPAVAGVFIVYLPILGFGLCSIHKGWLLPALSRIRYRRVALASTFAGLVCLGMASATTSAGQEETRGYAIHDDLYPVNVFYNLGQAFVRNQQSNHYVEASADFRFHATSEHPEDSTEIYVLVIGETARAHNFGLYGYPRATTPQLGITPGIIAFDRVTTQSNTTHKSVPMLLSAAEAADFSRLYTEKGILAAFHEAGFHTAFISNQLPNHSFIDFLGQQADECHFLKEEAKEKQKDQDDINIYDIDLLPKVSEILGHHRRKEFIVLHTYGSHFNYRERYPSGQSFFQPDTKADAKPENRIDLTNAYDNTIRYTDYVLHHLIDMLGNYATTSAVLYTSDHGENIFDDDRNLFLHASPRASLYELEVPFIAWTSQGYASRYPQIVSTMKANRHKQIQSSISVFHSMLQIGGVKTPYRDDRKSVASPAFKETPRMYLTDHNEAVSINRILN